MPEYITITEIDDLLRLEHQSCLSCQRNRLQLAAAWLFAQGQVIVGVRSVKPPYSVDWKPRFLEGATSQILSETEWLMSDNENLWRILEQDDYIKRYILRGDNRSDHQLLATDDLAKTTQFLSIEISRLAEPEVDE